MTRSGASSIKKRPALGVTVRRAPGDVLGEPARVGQRLPLVTLAPEDTDRHGQGSELVGDLFGVSGVVVPHLVLETAVGGRLMLAS
ncbi:hypothetical protein [Streptomyces niger]|uniref:hypothetical protein n=1 Tax=Streptomyces niger TaxID=66373 RepID=UPI0006997DBE|nr:hypothetical protein [Streptomyces niger]